METFSAYPKIKGRPSIRRNSSMDNKSIPSSPVQSRKAATGDFLEEYSSRRSSISRQQCESEVIEDEDADSHLPEQIKELFNENVQDESSESTPSESNTPECEQTIKNYEPQSYGICLIIFFVVVAVVVGLGVENIGSIHLWFSGSNSNYRTNIFDIRNKYPLQDENTWAVITSGLENVIDNNSTKSSVFLFLNSDQQQKTLNEITNEIAQIAARELGSTSPVILSETDIQSLPNEQGYFIHRYKPVLEKQRVLVVKNLHKIPAEVAQSFHYFCDSENPIVKRSVIIFTMQISKPPKNADLLKMVELFLLNLWSPPLSDNVIDPLITRLTSNIVAITPEIIYYR